MHNYRDDNFSLLETIDNIAGTHLSDVGKTINSAQSSVESIQPAIKFVADHYIELLIAFFIVLVMAGVVANKITGK